MPWFAFGFLAVVLLHSQQWLPAPFVHFVTEIDTGLLAMAMAGLGLTTHVSSIKKAGAKPLVLAAMLAVWLVVGGGLLNHFLLAA